MKRNKIFCDLWTKFSSTSKHGKAFTIKHNTTLVDYNQNALEI